MADLRARLAHLVGFQWDSGNATKNSTKHAVEQAECEQVFLNGPLLLVSDPDHSAVEARYAALGRTNAGRHLFVVFTLRAGPDGDLVRVISARPMSRPERGVYREAEEESE